MLKIVGGRGIGKTKELIEKASKENGIIVCKHPTSMLEKIHTCGYTREIHVESYDGYKEYLQGKNIVQSIFMEKPIFIDDLSCFMKYLDSNFNGYSECIEYRREY